MYFYSFFTLDYLYNNFLLTSFLADFFNTLFNSVAVKMKITGLDFPLTVPTQQTN